jgi:hypothetical protein
METLRIGDAAIEEGDRVPIGESSFNERRAQKEGSAEYKNTFDWVSPRSGIMRALAIVADV